MQQQNFLFAKGKVLPFQWQSLRPGLDGVVSAALASPSVAVEYWWAESGKGCLAAFGVCPSISGQCLNKGSTKVDMYVSHIN